VMLDARGDTVVLEVRQTMVYSRNRAAVKRPTMFGKNDDARQRNNAITHRSARVLRVAVHNRRCVKTRAAACVRV